MSSRPAWGLLVQGSSPVWLTAQKRLALSRDARQVDTAEPLDDNLFEWHFTIRGPLKTAFEGGVYHGRILLPHDYPFKPPKLHFTTKMYHCNVNSNGAKNGIKSTIH